MAKTPNQIFKAKIKMLLASEKSMDKAVIDFQEQLFELLASEYLPLFKLKDGVVLDNPANAALINRIDNYFDKLEKVMQRDILAPFVKSLLESASLSAEYYIGLGFKKTVVSNLLKNKINLETKLGVTPTGRLKKDGYLYKLGRTEQVRQQLKNFVITNLTGDTSFLDFQLAFRNLVIGNKRVKGLPTTGSLQRYFDQYAYDSFNELDAVANNQFAVGLNLNHAIYEGSIIDTSRRFCKKRAGQAFEMTNVKATWKNDPDLIDKKTKDSYNPITERGRYRCRHFWKYITKAFYDKLPASKKGLKKIAA